MGFVGTNPSIGFDDIRRTFVTRRQLRISGFLQGPHCYLRRQDRSDGPEPEPDKRNFQD